MMQTFHYNTLDVEGRTFRLLRLIGGDGPQIECEIFEAWLMGNHTIPFEALSYTWGDLTTPHEITLNSAKLAITGNLHSALRHLRIADEDRSMWIDAICIDQSNEEERGHQVGQMGDIYSQAEQVIFWLGNATPKVNFVMTALKRLERRAQKESATGWSPLDKRWQKLWLVSQPEWDEQSRSDLKEGLEELMQRPWFQRVWILQEVARAKRAVVCTGTRVISSRIFAIAPRFIHITPIAHCQAVLDIMPGTSREHSWWSQKRDLYTLLQRFRYSKASDPRDKVYAILGISSDATTTYDLQPDYTKTTEQVIDDATALLFGLPPCSFRTMDSFLNNLAFLTSQAFLALVRSGSAPDVVEFLQNRGDQLSIGTAELVAAAKNEQFGDEVMQILYTQPGLYVGDHEPVVAAAINNTNCGTLILHLLTWRPDKRVKKLVVDKVFNAAALKIGRAQAFYEWLLEQGDPTLLGLTKYATLLCHEKIIKCNGEKIPDNEEWLRAAAAQAERIVTLPSFFDEYPEYIGRLDAPLYSEGLPKAI